MHPWRKKRPRYDRVSEDILKFAVYVEKFNSSDDKIKLLGEDFDEIKAGISNAFILESCEVARKLRSDCEKRLYNSEKGEATFYTKSVEAQNFVLKVINNLNLQGIKARGPRPVIRSNLQIEIPLALCKLDPVVVLKKAVSINCNFDCEPIYRGEKENERNRCKLVSVELPEAELQKLKTWALDNKETHFYMFTDSVT